MTDSGLSTPCRFSSSSNPPAALESLLGGLFNPQESLKMSAPKPTLYATAGSLDGIRKCISQFYNGATITLDATNTPGVWSINNALGRIKAVHVRRVGFRLRFERLVEPEVVE